MNGEEPPAVRTPALMTYKEYEQTEHERPYQLRVESGGNALYYFGERHSFDPSDTQWEQMRTFWQEFLEKTNGKKRVAFVEGGKRETRGSEPEAIIKDGGMGLLTYLAGEADIPTFSPEPPEKEERAELEKQFPREEIQYYYFARMVDQWGRTQEPKPDFGAYVGHSLRSDKRESGWSGFDFSLAGMKRIHERLFGTEFQPTEEGFWASVVDPVNANTVVNQVARACSQLRDAHIVKEIIAYMKDGRSVFAEYGYSHVVMQEPLLRALLQS